MSSDMTIGASAETPSATTTAGGLFVRRSSGLVREFGAKDTFVFNLVSFAPALSIALIPVSLAATVPNVNVFALIGVAVFFAIANGLTYAYLSAAMPRSGGEYVFLGRTIHPSVGFVANWGFTWSQLLGIALYAGLIVTFAISVSFYVLGANFGSQGLIDAGTSVSEKWPTFGIATAIVVIVALVLSLGPRMMRRFLNIMFIPAAIGTVITTLVLLFTSHGDFVTHFNAFMADHADGRTYDSIAGAAAKAGFTNEPNTFSALVSAMPIAAFFFIGFTYSSYIGSEVKEPAKNQPRMILACLACCAVLYLLNLGLFYNAVGQDFYNAFVFLSGTDDGNGIPVSPVINLFAGMMTGNSVLNVLMALSFFIWPFILLFAMAAVCSRNLFAWAFDGVLPRTIAKVDSRFNAPWVAVLLIVACIEILLALYVFTTIFQNITNYTAIFSVAFWLASWAAIVLPYRRRDIFEAAPPNVRRRIAGVPVITIVGVGNLILYTLSLIGVFKFPAFTGPTGTSAVLFVVGIYVVGVVIYLGAQAVQRARGVDLNLLYREIPPE
jgi:basic amino acid/polyamine antiporter, APA family